MSAVTSSGRRLLFSGLTEGSAPSGALLTVIPNGRQEPSTAGTLPDSSCQTDGSLRPLWAAPGLWRSAGKAQAIPIHLF